MRARAAERFGWRVMLPLGHVGPGVAQQLLRHLGTVRRARALLITRPADETFADLIYSRPESIWLVRMLRPVYP